MNLPGSSGPAFALLLELLSVKLWLRHAQAEACAGVHANLVLRWNQVLPQQLILIAHVNVKDKGTLTLIRLSGARQACHLEAGGNSICGQQPL